MRPTLMPAMIASTNRLRRMREDGVPLCLQPRQFLPFGERRFHYPRCISGFYIGTLQQALRINGEIASRFLTAPSSSRSICVNGDSKLKLVRSLTKPLDLYIPGRGLAYSSNSRHFNIQSFAQRPFLNSAT